MVTSLDDLRRLIEARLAHTLPDSAPAPMLDAMRYGLLGGGKRLRPCLTLAAAEAVAARDGADIDAARDAAMPAALAIECIHSYSLVHDDLPAMDDDVLRRGRPTTHVVYGDGMAVLAGDGLLTHAFGVLAAAPSNPARTLRAIRTLADAAGAAGMVGGQAVDLIAAGRVRAFDAVPMTADTLRDMHARKTGALLRAAAVMGAILAGPGGSAAEADATIAAVDAYASELGLAFQIIDDILDVEGSAAELGKTAGKDAADNKPTYPSLYGLDTSRRMAADCITRAKDALAAQRLAGLLPDIADWTIGRTN